MWRHTHLQSHWHRDKQDLRSLMLSMLCVDCLNLLSFYLSLSLMSSERPDSSICECDHCWIHSEIRAALCSPSLSHFPIGLVGRSGWGLSTFAPTEKQLWAFSSAQVPAPPVDILMLEHRQRFFINGSHRTFLMYDSCESNNWHL